MSINVKDLFNNLHIHLDEVDSTNNYAMRLIDDDKAQNGQIVSARHQLNGKGQRSKVWTATKDKSLSTHIEDTVLVTDHGPEVLTNSSI